MNETDRRVSEVCPCGHPWSAHERVEGFDCGPDVLIDGASRVPDVWVCTGGRLVDVNDPNVSPWDCVCGCIFNEHEARVDSPQGAFLRDWTQRRVVAILRGLDTSGGDPREATR